MENENALMETQLEALAPCKLDDAYLARIENCIVGVWGDLTVEEAAIEDDLRALSPVRLDALQLNALVAACDGSTPLAPDVIIPMPGRTSNWKSLSGLAIAAAIALLGAATALLFPPTTGNPPATVTRTINSKEKPPLNNFTPAAYNRNLSEARSQGVIWRDSEPQRIVRVVYTECVTMSTSTGETVEVERPRIEYILLPAKVD